MRPATLEIDSATAVNGFHEFGPEVAALLDAVRDLASTLELPGLGAVWSRLCAGVPVIIPDVYADSTEARTFRSMVGEESLRTSLAFIRTCMWVPLVLRDHLVGLLSITCPEPNGYTPRHAQLALAIARQAAVGIENARLHERSQQAACSRSGSDSLASCTIRSPSRCMVLRCTPKRPVAR
jgi:GAF domain-containing protein